MDVSFTDVVESIILTPASCRCCLTFYEEESMDNMFECLYQDILLHEIINIIAPISIQSDDGYSELCCESCKASAIEAYNFRQTCIVSNEQIHSRAKDFEDDIIEHFDQQLDQQDQDLDEEIIFGSSKVREVKTDDGVIEFDAPVNYGDTFKTLDICQEEEEEEDNLVLESHFCEFCGEEYRSQAELEDHTSSQHLKQFKQEENSVLATKKSTRNKECTICGKLFETPSKLNRHLHVHRDVIDVSEIPPIPSKVKKYECEICGKKVESPSKLKRHLRVHEKESNLYSGVNLHRPFPCSECDHRFWDETKLERHKLIHSEAFLNSRIPLPDDHLFTCVVCLLKVPNYENCLQHMRSHRDEIGDNTEVSCRLCPKVYPKLANLVRHARIHPENATHQCVYCEKVMGMGDDLIDHMLRHEGFSPFVCKIESCGKSFGKSHKLKQHMETHNGRKITNFSCDKCDKTFSDLEYLKRHLIRHSGRKDHICSFCPARFTFKTGLNSHMATHTNEKPFSCDICSSKFTRLSSLRTHQRVHNGEKPYGCENCNMKFVTSGHLRRHMLTHSGIKPFQCSYCEKAYSQSNDLMKHLRIHLGPNVFKCDIDDCVEAFPKFGQLKNHKMMHCSTAEMFTTEESYGGDIEIMKLV